MILTAHGVFCSTRFRHVRWGHPEERTILYNYCKNPGSITTVLRGYSCLPRDSPYPLCRSLEIAAVFEGIFVDTDIEVFLDHIVAHGPKREVDQMVLCDGKVEV
jgi:hypothetical protein